MRAMLARRTLTGTHRSPVIKGMAQPQKLPILPYTLPEFHREETGAVGEAGSMTQVADAHLVEV